MDEWTNPSWLTHRYAGARFHLLPKRLLRCKDVKKISILDIGGGAYLKQLSHLGVSLKRIMSVSHGGILYITTGGGWGGILFFFLSLPHSSLPPKSTSSGLGDAANRRCEITKIGMSAHP